MHGKSHCCAPYVFLFLDPDGKMHIFEEIYSALLADRKKNPIGHWMSRMKRRDLIHLLGHQNILLATKISSDLENCSRQHK